MCGISGWFSRSDVEWRPTKEQIVKMIDGIKLRGYDATGYGTTDPDGSLSVYKGPISSARFIPEFLKDEQPIGPVGLLHTRGANVGDPKKNINNHPLTFESKKRSVIVVHNGTVGNLDDAYDKLGVFPEAEVDSALIAAALGTLGGPEGLEFLIKHSCGSAAIAALFSDGSVLLARDVSPLFFAHPKGTREGTLIWSSEVEPMKEFSEYTSAMNIPMWRIWGVPDSTYYYWDKAGKLLAKGQFRLPGMYKSPDYLKHKNYQTAHQTTVPVHTPAPPTIDSGYPISPSQAKTLLPVPMTELQKRACGFVPNPAIAAPPLFSVSNTKQIMDKHTKIHCNWSGCWKKSIYRIPWQSTDAGIRWVPLCEGHTNKWEKKGHDLVLSELHEMSRKTAAIVTGYDFEGGE